VRFMSGDDAMEFAGLVLRIEETNGPISEKVCLKFIVTPPTSLRSS